MTHFRPRFLAGSGILLALAGAGIYGFHVMSGGDTPTFKVKASPFHLTVTADGILKAVKATPVTAPLSVHARMTLAWIAQDGAPIKSGAVVARFDPADFSQKLLDGEADAASARAKIAKAEAQMKASNRELDLDAKLSKKRLAQAEAFKTTDADIFSRFDIVNSKIDTKLARSRLDHAEAVRQTKDTVSRTDVDLFRIEAQKAQVEIIEAKKALASMVVKAPHDGVVVLHRDWRGNPLRVGSTVFPGQKLAEIPETGAMQAKVFVLEADAGGLAKGQRAQVTIDAHSGTVYEARVERVDTLAQPRYPGVPVQYFGVTLSFSKTDPARMRPGQRLHAVVTTADMKSALVVPRQAVFQKGGKPVVYKRGLLGGFQPVTVELGQGVPGRVVVTKGLRDGDVIALLDPTARSQEEKAPKGGTGPLAGGPS
jgi:RND family efflux transporter MFP subunit